MPPIAKLIKKSKKKNIRLFYYLGFIGDRVKPRFIKRLERHIALAKYNNLDDATRRYIDQRVALYNKLEQHTHFDSSNQSERVYHAKDLRLHARFNGERSGSTYCIDSLRYIRCYNRKAPVCFKFGDVRTIPEQPTFVKSRPIGDDNQNSVLLKINRIRHFNFIKDKRPYLSKMDRLIGISYVCQEHRIRFMEMYFDHPMCHLGSICHYEEGDARSAWNSEHISIDEHLKYKFILCLEGNDVATNLKWVMSSSSIAVMPKPKFETWFMESRLVGDVHYIEIKDDYSDLEERLNYYIEHPDKAQKIITAAHEYIDQFRNRKIEHITSMMVAEKYFNCTEE